MKMNVKRMAATMMAITSIFCTSVSAMAAGPSEEERMLSAAKEIAYMDMDTASTEMKAEILEAREIIINSQAWVADNYHVKITHKDGSITVVPHFSELFPGWSIPKCDMPGTYNVMSTSSRSGPFVSHPIRVPLQYPSSNPEEAIFATISEPFGGRLDVLVEGLERVNSCNLGVTNLRLHEDVVHGVELTVGDSISTWGTKEYDPLGIRASSYSAPGYATMVYSYD